MYLREIPQTQQESFYFLTHSLDCGYSKMPSPVSGWGNGGMVYSASNCSGNSDIYQRHCDSIFKTEKEEEEGEEEEERRKDVGKEK